jgi:3-oxoadipate enol-lactonase
MVDISLQQSISYIAEALCAIALSSFPPIHNRGRMVDDGARGFADVNDTKLYYELAGHGEPLVLIHGFVVDSRMWDHQFQEFTKQYRVLRYDLRGYGKSAKPTGEDYTDSDDLMSLMKHLKIENAHIIGLSMGGLIAMDFTISYPKAVKKLVVADTTLSGYTWSEAYGSSLNSIWATCKKRGLSVAKAQFLAFEIFCTESEDPYVYHSLKDMIDDYSGIHLLDVDLPVWRSKVRDPIAGRLSDIRVPTLIVVGERDAHDFHIIADILSEGIPLARKLVVPGVKHMVNMEDPVAFDGAVLEFLSNH